MKQSKWSKALSVVVSLHLVMSLIPQGALASEVERLSVVQEEDAADVSGPAQPLWPAFDQEVEVDGAKVAAKADEGAFTEGAALSVREVASERQEEVRAAVDAARTADGAAATSYAFDVHILNEGGNELQPQANRKVTLGFHLPETADDTLAARVYQLATVPAPDDAEKTQVVATELEALDSQEDGVVAVEVDELSTFVVEFVEREEREVLTSGDASPPAMEQQTAGNQNAAADPKEPARADVGGNAPEQDPVTDEGPGATDVAEPMTDVQDEPVPDQMASNVQVRATSATNNLVGTLFANMVNEYAQRQGMADAPDDPSLAEYPMDHHDLDWYGDSPRVRYLQNELGGEINYLVYRDSLLLVGQDEAAGYEVTYTEDGSMARVSPAPQQADFLGKTGVVFLRQNVSEDDIVIFAGEPLLDTDGALLIPAKTADELRINHVFSDGRLASSGEASQVRNPDTLQQRLSIPTADATNASSPLSRRLAASANLSAAGLSWPSRDVSGTNWEGTISDIKPNGITIGWGQDVWNLFFGLNMHVKVTSKFDITTTGGTGTDDSGNPKRESVNVASFTIPVGVIDITLDYSFEAEFPNEPLHIKGTMGTEFDYSLSTLGGELGNYVSPVTFDEVTLTKESDKNKDVQFYIGTAFTLQGGFFGVRINIWKIRVNFGPLLSVNWTLHGGVRSTARWDKDTYAPGGEPNEIHLCTEQGKPGCLRLTSETVSKQYGYFKVDLYFKDWRWDFYDPSQKVWSTQQFYQSYTYDGTGKGLVEGVCPHRLYKVPVHVQVRDTGNLHDLANARVTVDELSSLSADVQKYAQATTDSSGRATIYLPYRGYVPWTFTASGKYQSAGNEYDAAGSRTDYRWPDSYNEELIIVEPGSLYTIKAAFRWNMDASGADINSGKTFALLLQRRTGPDQRWEDVYKYDELNDARFDASVSSFAHTFTEPRYHLENGELKIYEYRVGLVYYTKEVFPNRTDVDTYAPMTPSDQDRRIYFFTTGRADAIGGSNPIHASKFMVDFASEETDDSLTTTITATAALDIQLNKHWQLSDSSKKADEVYLALLQRPEEGWENLADERGVPNDWVLVRNPYGEKNATSAPSTTLKALKDAGVLTSDDIHSVQDVPLAIAKVSASGGWSTQFTVPEFRNGVKMRFKACELDEDVIRNLLAYEYDLDAAVSVLSGGAYTSTSVGTGGGMRYDWQRVASVVNTDTAHTISGTVRWHDVEMRNQPLPERVTLHITKDGVALKDLTLYAKDYPGPTGEGYGDYTWVWTLTDSRIEPNATYDVTEELPVADQGKWMIEADGLDMLNRPFYADDPTVLFQVRATFEDAGQGAPPSELNTTIAGPNYSQSVHLTPEAGSSNVLTGNPLSYPTLSQVGDITRFKLTAPAVPGYVAVCREPYLHYSQSDGIRGYFDVTYLRQNDNLTLEVQKEWRKVDGSTVYPQEVGVEVYRDDTLIATSNITNTNGQWSTLTISKDKNGNNLSRLDSTGRKYVYSVRETPVDGFTSEVTKTADTVSKVSYTIANTWVGSDYVNVRGTVSWKGDDGHQNLRPESVRLSVINSKGDYVRSLDVATQGDGSFEAKYLPAKDGEGNPLAYSVLQSHVDYYTATYAEVTTNVEDGHTTYICNVENELTGYYALTLRKEISGQPENPNSPETYRFTVAPYGSGSNDSGAMPRPVNEAPTITGAGTATVEFPLDKDGLYAYKITEDKGSDPHCTYDDAKKVVIIARTTSQDGKPEFMSWVGDAAKDDAESLLTAFEMLASAQNENASDGAAATQTKTVTFTNRYPGISIKKKWDIDLQSIDKPDSIQVVVQQKDGNAWKNIQIVELNDNNDWHVNVPLPDTADAKTEFRVRELREETVYDTLTLAGAEKLIVYDKNDADKPTGDDAPATNEVVYHVAEHQDALLAEKDAHDTKYRVTYESTKTGDNTSVDITNKAIVEIDVIKRWIGLGVDDEDMPSSAWLVLMCKPKAGALEDAKSLAGTLGVDLGSVLDYEFPVINPIEGGRDPITILGKMALGLDLSFISKLVKGLFGVKIPELAMKKVTKDDQWTMPIVDSKYTAGVPMEYKGAELTSEVIRLIVKYLTNGLIDSPVSFNPFDGYISIPTKAIRTVLGIEQIEDVTDLSGLAGRVVEKAKSLTKDDFANPSWSSLLTDYHLMANVFNIKVDWNTDDQPDDYPDSLHGQKTWDDQNNKYGTRPDTVKVYLLANGQRVTDDDGNDVYAETSQMGGWRYSFAGRPKTDDEGRPITYSVEEETVPGYTVTYSGFDITNKLTTTNVVVSKVWNDVENNDGLRPSLVTVHLRAGQEELASMQLSADNGWKGTFQNVPQQVFEGGKEVAYTLTEDPVDGYTTSVTGSAKGGFTVTNAHIPATITFNVSKKWDDANNRDGLRPASVTVRLLANGKEVQHRTLTEKKGWQEKFITVYQKQNGEDIAYTLTEDTVEGYESSVRLASSSGANRRFEVTNTHAPKTVVVHGTKVWDDNDDADGKRPDSVTVILYMNGRERERTTATAGGEWKWSFSEQYQYLRGQKNVFTVAEVPVDGYTAKVSGSAEDGFTITNTHTPETVTVVGSKTWNDANNQDGKRPSSITVRLMNGGEVVRTQRVSASSGWQWVFANVPKNRGGQPIAYTVEENAVSGYEASTSGSMADGFVITNTHVPETTKVEGTKTWDDANNQDGKRPTSITVRLLADGKEKASQTVTANNGWKWSFTGLPKYEGGKEIAYNVAEDPVDDYTSEVDGYDITNTHTPETMTVAVTKVWADNYNQDGKRPGSVTVHLLANGMEVGQATVTASDNWRWSFSNLPKYQGGEEIEYTLTEDSVQGYTSEVKGSAAKGFVVTNTHTPETITVQGSKTWDDNNNQDGKRPESIRVRVLANGAEVASKQVTAGDDWSWALPDLPKYENGAEVAYRLVEDPVDGYTSTVSGYNVTNAYTPEKTQVNVYKLWADFGNAEGVRPQSVTVRLLADGTDTGSTLVLSEDNGWTATFTNLDKFRDSGKEIDYTVQEDAVDKYTTEIMRGEDEYKNAFLITNTHQTKDVDIHVTKAWDDGDDRDGLRPQSVRVWLLSDGLPIAYHDVSAAEKWQWTFTDFPEYRNGSKVTYTVTEDPQDGYASSIAGTAADGFTITNTHTPEITQVTVYKLWDDHGNDDEIRPLLLQVDLYANDVRTGRSLQLAASQDGDAMWYGSFAGLFKNDHGKPISYDVREQPVLGYTETEHLSYVDESGTYFLLWNHHEAEGVTIRGTKAWDDDDDRDGLRPESVRVWLLWDGLRVSWRDVTAEDGWQWEFENFPKKHDGQPITYTVEEEPVEGYASQVTGSVAAGFTITNSHKPALADLRVYKFWDDWGDEQGVRPSSVTVHLWADGTDTGKTLTLDEGNGWYDTFEGAKKYAAGRPISYTVTEDAAPEYQTSIDSLADEDSVFFFVINTHEAPRVDIRGSKTWDDANNKEGQRPESVVVWLRSDGLPIAYQQVSAETNWTWSFDDFPEYREGKKVTYTVSEEAVEAYTPTYTGYDITNTHTPNQTFVEVHKVWDDQDDEDHMRPESVTVRLLEDGKETNKTLELSASNDWRGVFTGLDANRSDEHEVPIDYTIEEEPVDGYSSQWYGDMSQGFTIINTHTPVPDPDPDPDPNPDPDPDPVTHVITYDFNGGTYRGSAEKIQETHSHGEVISIHEAPVRDGYTFTYWKGSSYKPNDAYTVTEDHTFVAQWEKDPSPPSPRTPDKPVTPEGDQPGHTPLAHTADESARPLQLAILGSALLAMHWWRRRHAG